MGEASPKQCCGCEAGVSLPTGAGAVPAQLGLQLPLSSGYSFDVCNGLLFLGGKKCVELYFAIIIIISISIMLLCKHLFIAWVKLYFFCL